MKKVEKLYLLNMIGATSLLGVGIMTAILNLLQNNMEMLTSASLPLLAVGLVWLIFMFMVGEEK